MEVLISRTASSSSDGVDVLDHPGHRIVAAPDHPSVAGGIVELGRQQGGGIVRDPVLVHEGGQGGRAEERGVPGQDHDVPVVVAVVVGETGEGHGHGVAGPPLLDLFDELDGHARRRMLDERLGHPLGPVADDDHHPGHRQLGQGVQHMEDHGPTAQAVERLGSGRAHPGSLTCGQHHRRQLAPGTG